LVIEDGIGGDSNPRVLVYRLNQGKMFPSREFTNIRNSILDGNAIGIVDPIFLGFDQLGFPVIFACNAKVTIKE
jgi:hypothetical protein